MDELKGLSTLQKIGLGAAFIVMAGFIGVAALPDNSHIIDGTSESVSEEKEDKRAISYKEVVEKKIIPFETQEVENTQIASGSRTIIQQGVDGVKNVTYKVTYSDNIEIKREKVKQVVDIQPVPQIIEIGTYVEPVIQAPAQAQVNCDSNYSGGCVPTVGYDLDCPDIGFSVIVVGFDPHGFDGDGDGIGCEVY